MCSQARGEQVLAAGPRAASIAELLAREGFDAVAVDDATGADIAAERYIENELVHVRDRFRSVAASTWELPVGDASLDTVLLDDHVQQLAVPDRTLREAARTLRREGRLVLTATLDASGAASDQPPILLPHELLDVVTDHFTVTSADIAEGHVRIVAQPSSGGGSLDDALQMLAAPLTRTVAELHSDLLAANRRAAEERQRGEDDGRRILDLEGQLRDSRAGVTAAKEALSTERRKRSAEIVSARKRIAKLEGDRARLRYDLELARWKLGSLRTRRWWRIGSVLAELRRRPSRLVLAPALLAKTLVTEVERPPRPQPPAEGLEPTTKSLALDEARGPSRDVAEAPVPRRLIPVATVLGSYEDRRFEHEWHAVPLAPSGWKEALSEDRPDLLFVSSCGLRTHVEWSAGGRTDEPVGDGLLGEVTSAFREAGIPTAYWHSGDEGSVAQVEVARLFDVVFCTSEELAAEYRGGLAHDRVYLLESSTQPRLANPASSGDRRGVLVLRWLGEATVDDPTREAAAELGAQIVFCSDEDVEDPAGSTAEGLVGISEVPLLAKRFRVVVPPLAQPGESAAATVLLDLAASGTPMVTNPSPLVSELFGRSVIAAPTATDASDAIKSLLRSDDMGARSALQARRAVLPSRTTSQRADQILVRTGVADPLMPPTLTMMIPTNRPQNLHNVLQNLGRQDYPNMDAVLVLHGIDLDDGMVREEAERFGVKCLEVVRIDGSIVLGEVFNRGFAATSGEFIGKMDDDDFYGAAYASDLMACFDPSGADIVGKWTHFAYIEQLDSTVLRYARNEHTYQEILAISTLIMKREVMEEVSFPPMPSGSGSAFLRAAGAQGAVVYAGDRFNYLYVRSADDSQHTWSFSEFEMAARSDPICKGRNIDHVIA